jgi:hypothetical protein
MWHRLLCFLRLRDEFDYAPPALGPEVNHQYEPHGVLRCCVHCGGGCLHAIHRKPFDAHRMAQIAQAKQQKTGSAAMSDYRRWLDNHPEW